ncbi:hypothetical protein ACFO1B_18785 [Dactylosporangium siamense]|uniref:HEAT repeat domain-containing protein n=1 Tax=Dactylosporangium siamense TaxID=685454 RepID=A0A919PK23_9ACTN|nr:hypothetical protein [Dactylosporangium siamense]GIG43925.1 hypothetical protein Dsi01nite_019660 [Dactylosporangium siamense]
MRTPDELDTIDWTALTHAYGEAEDLPELVRALYDADAAGDALHELYATVWHQGSVYPATAAAVPFLAHAAVHGADPAGVLRLLTHIADRPAEELGHPVAVAVVEASAAAAVDLLPAARHADADLRARYARLAAAVPLPLPDTVVAELAALEAGDPDVDVRAEALTALAAHHPVPEPRLRAALSDAFAAVRLTAAVLTMRRSGTPYPPPTVEVVAAVGDRPRGDDQAKRITELLIEEPDTGFAVAARWIDAGDHDGHGSTLAAELHRTWRDRDELTARLLTRALPHHDTGLWQRLVDLELALSALPALPDTTRRALTAAAGHADERVPPVALRCLARFDAVPPDAGPLPAGVLAVLPAGNRPVAAVRGALATAEGNDAIALVQSLSPDDAARLLPELLALAGRGTAAVVIVRLLSDIPGAADDPGVTAALADAMRAQEGVLAPDEMRRATAAASWLLLGHPPAGALDVLREVLTTGRMPPWYLGEVARAATAAAPLADLVTPMLDGSYDWTRVRAAAAYGRITGDTATAATRLGAALGAVGDAAVPVHLAAMETLAAFGVAAAADRVREFRDSPRRVLSATSWPVEIPHPDDRLRDAARRALR